MPAPNIRFRAVAGPYAHRTDCLSTPTPPALRPNEFLEVSVRPWFSISRVSSLSSADSITTLFVLESMIGHGDWNTCRSRLLVPGGRSGAASRVRVIIVTNKLSWLQTLS